jgi:hypothetical protein
MKRKTQEIFKALVLFAVIIILIIIGFCFN